VPKPVFSNPLAKAWLNTRLANNATPTASRINRILFSVLSMIDVIVSQPECIRVINPNTQFHAIAKLPFRPGQGNLD
jgi:hypothetical protein